jgi:hypothetical protein
LAKGSGQSCEVDLLKLTTLRAFFFYLFVVILGAGCKSGAQLEEVNSSLKEIQRAAMQIIGKPRQMSSDSKEIMSQYRDSKGKTITNPEKVRERIYTAVYVLGDRRPFSIQVEVVHEMKNEIGQYVAIKKDDRSAEIISEKIKAELALSREGKSVLDDFKPF